MAQYKRVIDGKQPCASETKVDVIFRNKEKCGPYYADELVWLDRNEEYDVVMWREHANQDCLV